MEESLKGSESISISQSGISKQSGIPIRDRDGQGDEKWILVQSLSDVDLDKQEHSLIDQSYGRIEFHLVDLKDNKIYLDCLPSLILGAPSPAMFSLNDLVYITGGVTHAISQHSDFKSLKSDIPYSNIHYYFGGSCFDLYSFLNKRMDEEVWRPGPILIGDYCLSNCTTYLGKIYSFGYFSLAPKVYDPSVGGDFEEILHCVPSELRCCTASFPVIPDPAENRILVHLSGGELSLPALFAYYPPTRVGVGGSGGSWELVTRECPLWSTKAILVDGVIYLHSHKFPSLFRAFSIADDKWLEVRWSSSFKGANSLFGDNVDLNAFSIEFDALFSLGGNILCSPVWTIGFGQPHRTVEIIFPKFEVERSGETINLTPLSCYSYAIPATENVPGFLPV